MWQTKAFKCFLHFSLLYILYSISGSVNAEVTTNFTTLLNISGTITDVCNMSLVSLSESKAQKQVKCTCNSLNVDVDCSHLGITELPKLISFPKNVHIANFEGNKISNLNADTFYNGKELLELDMSYNAIDFVSVNAFKPFKKLMRLDLSHNRIWNLPTSVFEGLSVLKRLDLSYNDLINVFPDLFVPLTDLRELILKSNPLQELEPKHFEHLPRLELLDLQSTLLKVIPDHIFVFTPQLKVLDLDNNQLTEVPTNALKVLDHVKLLGLSGNPIEIIREEAFRGMRGLVILYLDRMSALKKIERYAFGDLIHLQELHCSYSYLLSEIDEKAFVKKTTNEKISPSQLFLRQDALRTLPSQLLNWNENIELHFRENPLECDCKSEWMVHLKLKNDFQKHVRCSGPSYLQGSTLGDLKDHELTCSLELSEIIMITCAALVALLIFVMITAFLLWRRGYSGYSKPYFRVNQKKHVDDIDYRGDDAI